MVRNAITGSLTAHKVKGREVATIAFSFTVLKVLVASTAGTLHPYPRITGITVFP